MIDDITRQLHAAITLDDRGGAHCRPAVLGYLRCVHMIAQHFTQRVAEQAIHMHRHRHWGSDTGNVAADEIRLFHFARECLQRCETLYPLSTSASAAMTERYGDAPPSAPSLSSSRPMICSGSRNGKTDGDSVYPSLDSGPSSNTPTRVAPGSATYPPLHDRLYSGGGAQVSRQSAVNVHPPSGSRHRSASGVDGTTVLRRAYEQHALRSRSAEERDREWSVMVRRQFAVLDRSCDDRLDMHEFALGCFAMVQLPKTQRANEDDVWVDVDTATRPASTIAVGNVGLNGVVFRAFDMRRSGFVEKSDFENAISVLLMGSPEERGAMAMRMFDTHDKGYITMHDFLHVMQHVTSCLDLMDVLHGGKERATALFEQLFLRCCEAVYPHHSTRPSQEHLTLSDMSLLLQETPLLLSSLGLFDTSNLRVRELKKSGTPVSPGHPTWPRVLSMMLGIRYCQQHAQAIASMREPLPPEGSHTRVRRHDFNVSFSLMLPPVVPAMGNPYGDESTQFTFQDHAPIVFRRIRDMFSISEEEYALSFSPEQLIGGIFQGKLTTLSEKITDGKSGNFFYTSHNGLFKCKTISHSELGIFRNILEKYLRHIRRYPNTLLCRYFGLHELNDTPFVVMGNAFETTRQMDHIYDLKGSTYKRTNPNPKGVLKDLDWTDSGRRIQIGESRRRQLLAQIQVDCEFLKSNGIIDYSLLVGISKVHPQEQVARTSNTASMVSEMYDIPPHKTFDGGMLSEDGSEVYFVSIIDTLIHYGIKKFAEHWIKAAWIGDGQAMSVTEPGAYASRFMSFMNQAMW